MASPLVRDFTCALETERNALNWAIPRTDMAIWCTQEFDRLENALWVQVPDVLKDHSNLVVTKADELGVNGTLATTLQRLNPVVDEEFQKLYAVATSHYLADINADGTASADVRKMTGAGAILDAVMGDVQRGRQADLDGAEVFLARYGIEDAPKTVAAIEAARPEAKVEQTPITPQPIASSNDEDTGLDEKIVAPALAIVHGRGREISELAKREDDISEDVLAGCVETIDQLVELLAENEISGTSLAEEIEEAYEMVVLMQLETGESSAADAATVVLQLSRELEMAKAA